MHHVCCGFWLQGTIWIDEMYNIKIKIQWNLLRVSHSGVCVIHYALRFIEEGWTNLYIGLGCAKLLAS